MHFVGGVLIDSTQFAGDAYTFPGQAEHGDSGTPVYDRHGSVFGLFSAVGDDVDGSRVVYVSPIKNFLKELSEKN